MQPTLRPERFFYLYSSDKAMCSSLIRYCPDWALKYPCKAIRVSDLRVQAIYADVTDAFAFALSVTSCLYRVPAGHKIVIRLYVLALKMASDADRA